MKSLIALLPALFACFTYMNGSVTPHLNEFLAADGTVIVPQNYSGSLDFKGFEVVLDECKGLIAKPLKMNSTWSGLSTGLTASCRAIAIDGSGNVYAGGDFTAAGGVSANRIAKWDGANWTALGTGFASGTCYTIEIDGSGNVYAGGTFTSAGGGTANRIAMWNGSAWSALGTGLNNTCSTLAIDLDDNVYAGGNFTTAGGVTVNRIGKWDGANWTALGTGLNGNCQSIDITVDGNVIAGGGFSTAGGTAYSRIAQWNGASWSGLGTGLSGGNCNAVFVASDGDVYAGGTFTSAGGTSAEKIAVWNGSTWAALGTGLGNTCWDIAEDGAGNIFAGGAFTTAGGVTANRIAEWNGSTWSALGDGLNQQVETNGLVIGSDGLYAGGNFSMAGGNSISRIAKWDGAVLPVELVDFKAVRQSDVVKLIWETANELFNKGFEIQRRNGGLTVWETIGFVGSKGQFSQRIQYEFMDKEPFQGLNSYRLKQMDFDGTFEYSNVVNIEFENSEIRIFPNPTSGGQVQIELGNVDLENLNLKVYYLNGELIFQSNLTESEIRPDLPMLSAGTYLIKIMKGGTAVFSERLLVLD